MNDFSSDSHTDFLYDLLKRTRNKLLDLSIRNSLLNYRFSAKKNLQMTSVNPDHLAQTLNSGKAIYFCNVPEPEEAELIAAGYTLIDEETGDYLKKDNPTAKAWAKYLNINTQNEYIDDKAEQKKDEQVEELSTLMFQESMNGCLRNIDSKAKSAIEDMGQNILYLILGFLEWSESESSDKKHMAPLLTFPVVLSKEDCGGVMRYFVKLTGDDLIGNETLNKKLMHDFNLSLPEIKDDITPEAYFNTIEETTLQQKPKWRLYRHTTLGLLNFTKQAMYQDLNPDNWPKESSLDKHSVLAHLYRDAHSGGTDLSDACQEIDSPKNYAIDHLEEEHKQFPLIYDADASQHSALIDAVKGNNLIIIGPPGSGKSQTITNLIAALIANKKKVLFVAEKMAALNVVKNRLDQAGLGCFCLELHSNKSNKEQMFQDLKNRLNKHNTFKSPQSMEADIAQCQLYKSKLNGHAVLINQQWKHTGLTIHEILTSTVNLRGQLQIKPEDIKLSGISSDDLTAEKRQMLLDHSDLLKDIFSQASEQTDNGEINRHFWYGVNQNSLNAEQRRQLIDALKQWNSSLRDIKDTWSDAEEKLGIDHQSDVALDVIQQIHNKISQLPDAAGELIHLFPPLENHVDSLESWLNGYKKIHILLNDLGKYFKDTAILNTDTVNLLDRITHLAKTTGIDSQKKLQQFMESAHDVRQIYHKTEDLEKTLRKIRENIPDAMHSCFTLSYSGTQLLFQLISLIDALPAEDWVHRNKLFDDSKIDAELAIFTEKLQEFQSRHQEFSESFFMEQLPKVDLLEQWYDRYQKGGLFKWFSSEWKEARSAIKALSCQSELSLNKLCNQLPRLIKYCQEVLDFTSDCAKHPRLAVIYTGINTPLERISRLRNWYKKVRETYGVSFMENASIGDALFDIDYSNIQAIKGTVHQEFLTQVTEVIEKRAFLQLVFSQPSLGLQQNSANLTEIFCELNKQCESLAKCINQITARYELSFDALIKQRSAIVKVQDQVVEWKQNSLSTVFNKEGYFTAIKPQHYNEKQFAAVQVLLSALKITLSDSLLTQSLQHKPDKECYEEMIRLKHLFNKPLQQERESRKLFFDIGQVDSLLWQLSAGNDMEGLIERNERALHHENWIQTWINYIKLKQQLSNEGIQLLIQQLEHKNIFKETLKQTVELAILYQLSTDILEQNHDLKEFTGMEQEAIRKQFCEYDRKIIEQQRKKIAWRADQKISLQRGVSSGRVKDYTELALINHNLGLKKTENSDQTITGKGR